MIYKELDAIELDSPALEDSYILLLNIKNAYKYTPLLSIKDAYRNINTNTNLENFLYYYFTN